MNEGGGVGAFCLHMGSNQPISLETLLPTSFYLE
jgi:hypothetical protein